MRQTHLHFSVCALLLSSLGSACTEQESSSQESATGNAALGIANFVTQTDADRTSVVGLDVNGNEVGRLELIHGSFTVSPQFAQDFDTAIIEGIKLDVAVGDHKLSWENLGYDPVTLPAEPASERALAAFVADPHVEAVLTRWQIGFQPFQGDDLASTIDEAAYALVSGSYQGTNPYTCGSSNCGSVNGKTINMCNGGSAINGARITRNNSSYRVLQCCPPLTGGQSYFWYGEKSCPFSGNSTECGTKSSGAACKGCPAHLTTNWGCSTWTGATSASFQYDSCSGLDCELI